ncbi:uncharacterized protein LOC110876786 [Helianthus annuus]|uniref:uncharacterized protein LOC110876786 n=1 Tax=Helianthus annuus TaxID=4232 RepID=UPI000B8F0927|nr:uncharacterized protein LOC110876786 [Helianthus annuus]
MPQTPRPPYPMVLMADCKPGCAYKRHFPAGPQGARKFRTIQDYANVETVRRRLLCLEVDEQNAYLESYFYAIRCFNEFPVGGGCEAELNKKLEHRNQQFAAEIYELKTKLAHFEDKVMTLTEELKVFKEAKSCLEYSIMRKNVEVQRMKLELECLKKQVADGTVGEAPL